MRTVPPPPYHTFAAACGITSACGSHTFDVHAVGQRAELADVGPAAERQEHAHVDLRQLVDHLAVDAREEAGGARDARL